MPPHCTDLGIQLRQQMLPELSPCPPFMSSCPFSPRSGAAVPRPCHSCVVPAAAWLLLSNIHALGAWRSHIHCQEQLGPPSRKWELVIITYPGLWKCLPVTWLKTRLSTCILGECKGWKCFVFIWALVFLRASLFQENLSLPENLQW